MESKKILIVDDNAKNRKLLRVILRQAGYIIFEAEDGREGVDAAQRIGPHLILMDYRMPEYDGIQATQILKADAATSHIPVFIVTSSAMKGDLERIMAESGCDQLFNKPIDYRAILDAVQKQLGG